MVLQFMRRSTSYCMILIFRQLWKFLFMFLIDFLYLIYCLFFLYRSPYFSLRTVFDAISSNIDEVLSINPSANVFVFRDFNLHHMDWLTYSDETDIRGELCNNSSISNNLTQKVNFPTLIREYHSSRFIFFF